MSLSTKIEDLPGSHLEEEIISHQPQQSQQSQQQLQQRASIPNQKLDYQPINVKLQEKESLFVSFKNEINEENILIYILLLLSSTDYLDNYLKHLSYYNIFVKSGILLFIYIVIKIVVLPIVKL